MKANSCLTVSIVLTNAYGWPLLPIFREILTWNLHGVAKDTQSFRKCGSDIGPPGMYLAGMEGPSLVIAAEEFQKYIGEPIAKATGTAKLPFSKIKKARLERVTAWGKHFILVFNDDLALRVHFLMFGSYRINNPRPLREPKLHLVIDGDEIDFYSCAIKEIAPDLKDYDWATDVMSKAFKAGRAVKALESHPDGMLCDLLMRQEIFSGLGNIMKNEILFHQRMHPETRLAKLEVPQIKSLVREARKYARQFYQWKKKGELKKNWQVFRKKNCPICEKSITKRPTGREQRISHFCTRCQPKI